ncbi:winged helix-turn-helix domain-containing protein, partial [Pseudoalteromonas sp. GB56]
MQTLPPKAIAVLTFLAEHQGQVISQDILLGHVWENTVVSPNTLQRCIALLRKALGDDAKAQDYIKTHAKKGYSLECDVKWQDLTPPSNKINTASLLAKTHPRTEHNHRLLLSVLGVSLLAVCMVVLFMQRPAANIAFTVDKIRPITSTDNRELASIYSPNGKFVVFKRYPEVMCVNNLWAK